MRPLPRLEPLRVLRAPRALVPLLPVLRPPVLALALGAAESAPLAAAESAPSVVVAAGASVPSGAAAGVVSAPSVEAAASVVSPGLLHLYYWLLTYCHLLVLLFEAFLKLGGRQEVKKTVV